MKKIFALSGRFALSGIAAAAILASVPNAWALGLGRLQVQSSLGELLRAEIDVTSLSAEESTNLRIRVAPPEAYRAAGVEYNTVLPATQVTLERRSDGRPYLRLVSDRAVQEPFVDVILEMSWATGRLVREYTLLFDPPTMARPVPTPATPPAMAAAPAPAAPAIAAAPAAPAPRAPRAARPAADTAVADTRPTGPDEYRVRSGDTLSKIAGRTQRGGVSLDQMLVALFRANPQAFVDNNMNRLRSGVVLAVPSAEDAKGVAATEARQVIQAQAADFNAYRSRLAGVAPAAAPEGSGRQAAGKVQASVDDRKQAAAPAPDKLTLSKGAATAKAAEDASKATAQKEASSRVSELSKNVEELKKLQGAAASAPKVGATVPAAAAPTPATPAPTVTAAAPVAPPPPPPPPPPPAPAPVAPPPPAAPPVAAAPASVPAMPAPMASAPVVAEAPASAPVVAQAPAAAPPKPPAPKPPITPAPAAEPPSFLGSLMDDNPLAVVLGGGLIALLAGFGIYRWSRRSKKDSGETSFLESRLQPDSFFGASGGQRVDTRDAGGTSSSMSYSLSQLDAIGDVDPVAEADVYLAYGRDLQAEEILKEAMRANPDRMAIRTKLLEVYAKRRDIKGFELLATQVYSLTKGEGDDWAKVQELGQKIDPENRLYQPGGAPPLPEGASGQVVEPLGATTMPQSVLPSPSQYGDSVRDAASLAAGGNGLDLDLDLGGAQATSPGGLDATQTYPAPAPAPMFPSAGVDLDLPTEPPPVPSSGAAPLRPAASAPVEFDLSGISLDLDVPVTAPGVLASARAGSDSGFSDLGLPDMGGASDADPFARKLELAEEFRQIGDMDGARDLLQEVVSKAGGALKAKAQTMLDEIG